MDFNVIPEVREAVIGMQTKWSMAIPMQIR